MFTTGEKKKACYAVAEAYSNTLQSLSPDLRAFVNKDVMYDFYFKSGTDSVEALAGKVQQ
jgi:hypothetical protein